MTTRETKEGMSRRDFIKTTSALSLAAAVGGTGPLFASGADTIKVGVIGCGGRGTGAAINCFESSPGVKIVAMGDLFQDRVEGSFKRLKEKVPAAGLAVTPDKLFHGFDNFEKVIASDINMVILASPPQFRPKHVKAAVAAGKQAQGGAEVGVQILRWDVVLIGGGTPTRDLIDQ